MDKLKMQSRNAVESNVKKIAALFPQCVTERLNKDGKPELAIDFDKLRDELSKESVEGTEERYQFTWPDKRAASRLANEPTDKTLRPDIKSSVDFWNTQNLYIEGDNLDVLKVLRENYLGKVKMIYIDPPYNTGNDFVYNDDFNVNKDTEESRNGLFDEEGMQVLSAFERNTVANGRFHTDWLNMIYPRLKVARDLLADDGVIFISIDDNELNNLRKVCDEIFGSSNFEATIIPISNPGGRDYKQVAITNEYLLIYSKTFSVILNEMPQDVEFKLQDNSGGYDPRELRNRNPKFHSGNRPNLFYPFYVNPSMRDENGYCPVSLTRTSKYTIEVKPYNSQGAESVWRWGKQKAASNIVLDSTDKSQIMARQKSSGDWNIYEKCRRSTTKAKSVWSETEMRTENGTREVRSIFGSTYFDHPKPLGLLLRCAMIGSDEDSVILDFFSGSATTAHAVMKLNAEGGGHRKFIMVQLPEVTEEKSEARKAGYETICQIGEERIRRAGKKVKEEAGEKAKDLDTGFRVLKLDSSNMEDVFYRPEDFSEQDLFNSVDNVKPDRTSLDLLFQVLPELNIELSAKIEEKEVNGKKVFLVDGNYLVATFDKEVNESTVTEIAKMKPQYFVMRDASAANDNVLDNFEQIFKHYSPDTTRKIL
ncbi:MAG: site-specific DNA-methyltransferase [Odoribacter sp.]|nr:site-specific DNA-methyltransferase [Odoribacter sp.]